MIILRQKEYTSLGLKLNAKIGRLRTNTAAAIQKSIEKNIIDEQVQGANISNSPAPKSSPGIDKTLGKAAQNCNAMIKNQPLIPYLPKRLNNFTVIPKVLPEDIDYGSDSIRKTIDDARRRNKNSVIFSQGGIDYKAHEIGHAKRAISGNPITKFISSRANNPETRQRANNASIGQGTEKGILEAMKGFLNGTAIIREEAGATNEGLKLLKRGGMSKENLKLAKNNLNYGLNTYKLARNNAWKIPLKNMIEIPSRRPQE